MSKKTEQTIITDQGNVIDANGELLEYNGVDKEGQNADSISLPNQLNEANDEASHDNSTVQENSPSNPTGMLADDAEEYTLSPKEAGEAVGYYNTLFAEAEKKKNIKEVSFEIIKWDKAGETLTGEIQACDDFTGGDFEGICNQWRIATDRGVVSCVLGSASDKHMADCIVGDIVRIQYRGKKEIKGGKKVNLFNIKVIKM